MLASKIKEIVNGRVITKDSKVRDSEGYTVYITNKKGEDISNKNFTTIQEAREYRRKMIMEGYHAEMYPFKDGGPGSGPAKGYKGKPSGWSRFAKLSPEAKKAEIKNAMHKR